MKRNLRLVFLFASASIAMAQTDVIGFFLSWQRDPATTMTVTWVNLYPQSPAQLWFRPGTNAPWLSATGAQEQLKPSSLQLRRVELTGLQPDTLYDFVLMKEPTNVAPKGVLRFRTMPATLNRPVRFVAGGDMMHSREWVDAMNRRAGALEPDFALLGGDLAYEDGAMATRWVDWLQSWMLHAHGTNNRCIPLVAAIGNHEVRGGYNGKVPEDAPYFFGLFRPQTSRAAAVLDFRNYLSLLLLDSGHTEAVPGPQTEWLRETLAARTNQKFLFPTYHYPAYGTAKSDAGMLPCDLPRAIGIRTNWVPLFERYGVTAVFENDHHNYKRTHPIRAHQRDDTNGIVYLGDGAWGVETRTVPTNVWYLAHAEARRHLFLMTLETNGTAQAQAVSTSGNYFDRVRFNQSRTLPAAP